MQSLFARREVSLALFLSLLLFGCHPPASTTPAPASTASRTYSVRGKIVSTDATHVTLNHQAIPGFMDAMIMPYQLADPTVVSELHPGDLITATLHVPTDPNGTSPTLLDNIVIIGQARPDYKPAVQYHVPTPGDPVPDFKLINQDGRPLHLAQFQGKILLITFIYTRCPVPDFCPRMSRNFAAIDQALSADPRLYAATHLLSISFDPAADTPSVLHTYGASYIGQTAIGQTAIRQTAGNRFSHWDFAVPPAKELPAITQFFNVGITPGDSNTLNHSLSTLIIDKQGRIAAWYPSNDWTPADLLARIKELAPTS